MERTISDEKLILITKKLNSFIKLYSKKTESDFDECLQYFNKHIKQHLIIFGIPFSEHMDFYRLRLNLNKDENLSSINTFSYCPFDKSDKIPLGRLNFAGQPIFYCSTDIKTCIDEMKRADEDEVSMAYFSAWETNKLPINVFVTLSPENGSLNEEDLELEELIIKKLSKHATKMVIVEYMRVLGKMILGESYILSSILGNYLFNISIQNNNVFDSVIYPSVQREGEIGRASCRERVSSPV